ncbi:uncharacterized protein LOC132549957 [Ylistrum balloti]|uniref:uncharacterized protein LOC132549957 n=1 Tax=Ylistrum balloti TaxID=509963 RepID=UPI0029058820|nr:uncharacterized protein LOC132549957 [Ylistrum balloti]
MAASTASLSLSEKESKVEKKTKHKHNTADHSLNSACLRESKMSLDCIARHNYEDNAKCEPEFQNYRNCKKFWTQVQWRRFFRGQRPTLPLPEDREQAKKDNADIMEKILASSPKYKLSEESSEPLVFRYKDPDMK